MKDEYTIALFSWHTLTEVITKGRFDAAYYTLPYTYLSEAIRSSALSKASRIAFLGYA